MSTDRDQEFIDYIYNDDTPFEVLHRPVWGSAGMKAAMDYAAEHPTLDTIKRVLQLKELYEARLEHLGAEPQSLETTAGWIRNNWSKEEQHEDQNSNSK